MSHYGVLMNFWEDEQGGEDFIISAKKMGQCVPSSETSEILWKKSHVFRKISHVFQEISNVFWKKSHVFGARSEVGTLLGGFWGVNVGQKEKSRGALGEKKGGFEGEVSPFFSLSISSK